MCFYGFFWWLNMNERLIKSKERVKEHGEVFTPSWMVEDMLDLVKSETEDIYKTFLEPAAGDGNFLTAILRRKLESVKQNYDKRYWQTKSLFALASIYGIEIQKDNLHEARQAMLDMFVSFHIEAGNKADSRTHLFKSARHIIHENIVWGDTLKKCRPDGSEIVFSEWRRVPNSVAQVARIPFTFASLFNDEDPKCLIPINKGQLQLSLFEDEVVEQKNEISKYKIVDIKHVWKEAIE